jgi:hypothetical protein
MQMKIVPDSRKVHESKKVPESNFADIGVDEKGGISVRAYAIGSDEINEQESPKVEPELIEESKEDLKENDEDEFDLGSFMKEKQKQKEADLDEDDKEDEENIKGARASVANFDKPNKIGKHSPNITLHSQYIPSISIFISSHKIIFYLLHLYFIFVALIYYLY